MNLHPPAALRNGAHHCPLRVYYEDTDAAGIVYHANYLRFAERARTEALRDLGVPHSDLTSQHGLMFMVRRVKVDYLGPALLDDSLCVITKPFTIRAASVELNQRVVRSAEPERSLAELDLWLACIRLADRRPARLPARWRDALSGMVQHAPPTSTSNGAEVRG
jgi:acyl-CoA thioester hydrolase